MAPTDHHQENMQANHLDTYIASNKLPIYMRTVQAKDAERFAVVIDDTPWPVSKAQDAIAKQRESASQPTILGPDGRVVSGPGRVNMAVMLRSQPGADATADEHHDDDDSQDLLIGVGGYGHIEESQDESGTKVRIGDTGVVIDKAYRGKGYAVEALKIGIRWAFTPVTQGGPQLDMVTVTTSADNAPMIKLAEDKLGLKGIRRWSDQYKCWEQYYEIKPEEWEN